MNSANPRGNRSRMLHANLPALRLNDKTAPLPMIEALTEIMAAPQGFEPRYYGPEPHVLPLDEGAAKPKSLVGPLR